MKWFFLNCTRASIMIITVFLLCVGCDRSFAQFDGGDGSGGTAELYVGNLLGNSEMYVGGAGDGDAMGALSSPVSVPVTWLYFNARALNAQSVLLQWATAMEMNNSHFEIERSLNGRDFMLIATEEGKGTTQNMSTYTLVDGELPAGVKVLYYRVRQVDFDGQSETTPIEVVRFEDENGPANKVLSVFPNPFGNELTLTVNDAAAYPLNLTLSDLSGRVVFSKELQASDGAQSIPLPDLPAGMYLLSVQNDRVQETLRVLKY